MTSHHRSRIRVNEIEISYLDAGESGPPVVLIHGMAETADSCWSSQITALSNRFRCFAPDLRGHGQTTLGDADGTLEQFGRDLSGFLEAVTGPATVVGFSLGGTIALWTAAQNTGLITHAISIGGSSVISRKSAEFFREKDETIRRGDLLELQQEMADEVEAMFHSHKERAPGYGARRIASIGEGGGYANAGLAMARMREFPLQPELTKIDCPVDVVGGEYDAWCPQKASDIILDGLPRTYVRFTEIPSVGHLMSVDEPDVVSDTVARLIAQPPAERNSNGLGVSQ